MSGEGRVQTETVAKKSASVLSVSKIADGKNKGRHAGGEKKRPPEEPKIMVETIKEYAVWAGIPVLVIALLRIFVIGIYTIPSSSMEDTLKIGNNVMTWRIPAKMGHVSRGDVIVFKDPMHWLSAASENSAAKSGILIKRIIGVPGDTVECDGDGSPVKVNGVAIDESAYLKPGVSPSQKAFSVTVTAGNLFVMGDNRSNSADSRYHINDSNGGQVPIANVEGVAAAVYWPLTSMKTVSSHHEVFKDVPSRTV